MQNIETSEEDVSLQDVAKELEQKLLNMGANENISIKKHVEELTIWIDKCLNQDRLNSLSNKDSKKLRNVSDRLKLRVEENLRIEGEGGITASKEQIERTENMLKISRHLDKILEHCSN